MFLFKFAVMVSVIVAASTGSALSQSAAWISANPGQRISCLQICQEKGGKNDKAVRGGLYRGETPYFVCAADIEGLRPGVTITTGDYANLCDVPHSGKAMALSISKCLCSNKIIKAQ